MTAFIKNGYGFVHIPKCGGTSITLYCRGNVDKKEKAHKLRLFGQTKHATPRMYKGVDILFTQVRNPYARMVSLWAHFMSKGPPHLKKYGLNLQQRKQTYKKWEGKQGFRYFLTRSHEELPIFVFHPEIPINLLTQSWWYEGCDHIFRLEDQDIWGFLRKHVGPVHGKPKQKNTGHYKGDWRDYHDEETRKFIKETFGEEIERFKYEF